MTEFLHAIMSPVNFALTVLMCCLVLYWLVVMIGMADLDFLDFDVDVDTDVDVDADVASGGGHGFMTLLKFFNVGEVPLMILLSVFVMMLWLVGVLTKMWFGDWSLPVTLLALIPMVVGCLLLTKLMTHPLRRLFEQLERDANAGKVDVMGQRCKVVSAVVDERHGQAEIETGGSPLRISVKVPAGGAPLERGDEIVVVADRDEKGVYTVRGF
ncbi:MAG: hypothetical protein ACIAXF_07025 [Phycisphaerales bacterium JB063]